MKFYLYEVNNERIVLVEDDIRVALSARKVLGGSKEDVGRQELEFFTSRVNRGFFILCYQVLVTRQ
ncbi:MAG: hypothetical protein K0S39_1042 [Paenibacillus sp.]|jgi:hypothetical protein|nr:hypothetical protein [Paenibacillus sp.]